ncbi:hypothetical protein [Parvicella tangerina]|uniref:Uncharacterized protein n=1 Tax=Parvicella tangerina TaxID=2829795 RepID=A0A916JM03_9FLAO|nr:hypothetical protein [Parvicella tangerina]CAG5081956.1 hypothetical protein CRYO30217_01771 [Parvicella tangerina]
MARTFALKRGYCHIDDENLMISMSDQPYKVKNPKVNFQRVFFGAIFVLSVVFLVQALNGAQKAMVIFYGFAAGIVGLNLLLNWNKNNDTCIPVKDVSCIEYKPAGSLTNDFFLVKYVSNGRKKQRILMLHRSIRGNKKELEKIKKHLSTVSDIDCNDAKTK